MATAPQAVETELQQLARRHLWMHFSRMGAYGPDHEIPIIARGEGCYVYDEHGKRYLDGLIDAVVEDALSQRMAAKRLAAGESAR